MADFSAIEVRVIAWFAGEKWRQDVFAKGGDIYCASASQMFKVPVGNEDILEILDFADIAYGIHSRIRIVGNNEIHLTVFKKIHALAGGTVRDFDMDIRKMLMESLKIRNQVITADGVAGTDTQLTAV